MLDITEYNTKHFSITAKAHGTSQWLEFSFNGQTCFLFFDSPEVFDDALKKLQSVAAPEREQELEYQEPPPTPSLDDEVPF